MIDKQNSILNISQIREDFPILSRNVYGKAMVYLDNGATSQKPKVVIDAIDEYYRENNANIHRGVHYLSQKATDQYEEARETIQKAINAEFSEEIIFTTGTTGGINMIAFSLGETLDKGDEIIISAMEHHSNIVPWQILCERKGCKLNVAPINEKGELIVKEFKALLTPKTRIVSISHISNTLGTINPIKEIIQLSREAGALTLIDGAQSIQHMAIDVQKLDCDFFAFSGHKVFGPTGVGVLYGKKDILNSLPPYQGGGDMIEKVTFEKTTYNELPHKFEAGTPNIVGGIGLGKAFEYLATLDMDLLQQHENDLLKYAEEKLKKIEGLRIIGTAENKVSVVSFVIDGLHPFDVGTLLDKQGIAVRTGHHCTQPLMDFFQIPGTIRASFAFYNTKEEVDALINGIERSVNMLK
jgi:cysteine desulfurase/selenocysteine lyase